MSAICPNCKASLGCSCQRRQASNGASVCSVCLSTYESTLNATKVQAQTQAPTNVTVLYNPARK